MRNRISEHNLRAIQFAIDEQHYRNSAPRKIFAEVDDRGAIVRLHGKGGGEGKGIRIGFEIRREAITFNAQELTIRQKSRPLWRRIFQPSLQRYFQRIFANIAPSQTRTQLAIAKLSAEEAGIAFARQQVTDQEEDQFVTLSRDGEFVQAGPLPERPEVQEGQVQFRVSYHPAADEPFQVGVLQAGRVVHWEALLRAFTEGVRSEIIRPNGEKREELDDPTPLDRLINYFDYPETSPHLFAGKTRSRAARSFLAAAKSGQDLPISPVETLGGWRAIRRFGKGLGGIAPYIPTRSQAGRNIAETLRYDSEAVAMSMAILKAIPKHHIPNDRIRQQIIRQESLEGLHEETLQTIHKLRNLLKMVVENAGPKKKPRVRKSARKRKKAARSLNREKGLKRARKRAEKRQEVAARRRELARNKAFDRIGRALFGQEDQAVYRGFEKIVIDQIASQPYDFPTSL